MNHEADPGDVSETVGADGRDSKGVRPEGVDTRKSDDAGGISIPCRNGREVIEPGRLRDLQTSFDRWVEPFD